MNHHLHTIPFGFNLEGLIGLFLLGILGGGHCLLMCGGIAHLTGTVSSQTPQLSRILAYNFGRILGYTLLGAMVGALSQLIFGPLGEWMRLILSGLAGLILIFMGLYIGGWKSLLLPLEKAGAPLWRLVEPLTRRLMPPRTHGQSMSLGILWGFLPCGMVYGALLTALASASVVGGALSMFVFGLGTLPNLILIAWGFAYLGQWRSQAWFRYSSAALLIAWGLYTALRSPQLNSAIINLFC